MAAATNVFVRGHTRLGHVTLPGSVEVVWGKTGEDGVSLQMNVTTIDLFSSQSKMNEDTGITQVGMELQVSEVDGALKNLGYVYGLPDTAFTGTTGLPTQDEILKFNQNEIGEQERRLFTEGPGPLTSVRRIDVYRAKLANVGPLAQSKTAWWLPNATWRALTPTTGPVVQILDNV